MADGFEDIEQSMYDYWQPLREAADSAIEYAQNPQRRVYMGLRELDQAMRGTAPRQLTIVQGYSHNGKNVVINHMVESNPDKCGVYATPDESRLSVLAKLTAASTGISWEVLEEMLRGSEANKAKAMLYETAERYRNLAVIEQGLSPQMLTAAVEETRQATSRNVDYVIYDFAKLFYVEGDERQKLNALKWWNVEHGIPVFVLHQVGRGQGRDGEPITIDSGYMGGEDVATFIIGVRRKVKWYDAIITECQRKLDKESDHTKRAEIDHVMREAIRDRDDHLHSITINLVKNKLPSGRLVPEFDLDIDWKTGTLQPRGSVAAAPQPTIKQQVFGGV